MSIESYIHGVGNHHEAETFYVQKQASYTREMNFFDNFHLQCRKHMGNMYSMEAQRLEYTIKKDNNQKNRGDVLKLKMESQRVGNAVSRGVSARLGHDLTTAGSFIVPNNLPL